MSSSPVRPLAILLLAAAIAPGLVVGTSSVINTTCTAMTYLSYDYCVSVLSADPAGASATNMRGLAIAAANLTAHKVKSTLCVLTDLVDELSTCVQYYKQMDELVASALDDFRAGRAVEAVLDKLQEASGEPNNCDILLFEGRAGKDPMSKENSDNDHLARLASDITQLIVKEGLKKG